MKRLFVAAMVFCMSCAMVACGSQTTASDENGVTSESFSVVQEDIETGQSEEGENTSADSDENNSQMTNLEIEAEYSDWVESEGLECESNGDGTCTLIGIGICKDSVLVIPEKSQSGDVITKIGEQAFYGAEDIETIIFVGRQIEIEEKAFMSCEAEKIVFTGSEIVIGEYAFSYCDDIKEIYISNSKIQMDEYAFYESGKDTTLQFVNSDITLGKKALMSTDLISVAASGGVLTADEYAFSYCDSIESVAISDCELSTDSYAFYEAGDKAVIELSACTIVMEDKAFMSCDVTDLKIEDCDMEMGESAFSYCDRLEKVYIGEGKTSMDSYAFYGCESLTDVCIGGETDSEQNVIFLDDKAFMSCGIVNLSIAGGNIELGDYAFSYCEDLESVTIGKGTLEVGKYVFYGSPENLIITYDGSEYSIDSIQKL
jgi:hypothetical protein